MLYEVITYMYRDKYCAYTESDRVKVEKTTYEECITKSDFPKLISNIVEVGDYVSYDAGTWNNTIATSGIEADGFGGYSSGNSKNSGLDCASSGSILINNSGTRKIPSSPTASKRLNRGRRSSPRNRSRKWFFIRRSSCAEYCCTVSRCLIRLNSVITSYSIHYTKLYEEFRS